MTFAHVETAVRVFVFPLDLIFTGYKLIAAVDSLIVHFPVLCIHLEIGGRFALVKTVDDLIVAGIGVACASVAFIAHDGGGYVEAYAGSG